MHDQSHSPELRKVLTALLGAAIVVGGTIGVGILRTPGTIAGELGHPWLVIAVWVAGALLALLGANPYAELATAVPKAGGPMVYAERAFGPAGGAMVGWADAAISITSLATLGVAIAEYAIPGGSYAALHLLAMAILAGFATLTWFGLRTGAATQQWLSFAKVGGIVGLGLAALILLTPASSASPAPPIASPVPFPGWLAVISATVIVSEVYAGWNSAVYFSEEDRDASKNAPRALLWGIAGISFSYILFNAALLWIVPIAELGQAKLAAASLATRLFGESGDLILRLFAIVSLCGIVNVIMMFTPRIFFGMGRAGIAPAMLARVNRHGTPGPALLFTIVPALVLAATLGFDILFAVTAFLGLAVNLLVFVAFFRLRIAEPDLPRPFRAIGYPWLPGFVTLVSAGLLLSFVVAEPGASAIAIACLFAGGVLAVFGTRGR